VVVVRNGECRRRSSGIRTWICPRKTRLSLSTVGAVALPNIRRGLTLSFGTKLPIEARKCSEQYKGNLYCLASELAFWGWGRVSLLITQVKLQRAWSVLGWVTAIRYSVVVHTFSGTTICVKLYGFQAMLRKRREKVLLMMSQCYQLRNNLIVLYWYT
jgi:hypothetical protein